MAGGVAGIWLTWPEEGMLPPLVLRLWGLLLAAVLLGVVVLLPALLQALHRKVLRPVLTALLGPTGALAAENLVRQPRRTAATVCALMVSLAYMVTMGGVKVSQTTAFDRWYEKTVAWDINVSSTFTGLGGQVELEPGLERELAAVEGGRLVSPQKFTRVLLDDGEQAFLQAMDHKRLRQYSETLLEEGDWAAAADAMERGGSVIVSPAVAWQDETATTMAVLVREGVSPEEVKARILARWGDSHRLRAQLNREFWQEMRAVYEGEAVAVGLVAGLIGLPMGLWGQWAMVSSSEFINGAAADMVAPWSTIGLALAVGLLLAPLAGLLPAR